MGLLVGLESTYPCGCFVEDRWLAFVVLFATRSDIVNVGVVAVGVEVAACYLVAVLGEFGLCC